MLTIDPKTTPTPDLHQYLVGAVAPRPIAFVSSVDERGRPNLAPYSFFNVFSSRPPTCIFSANRRVRDNTTKDTLHNVEATGECVINVVTYPMLRQMALTSVEFPPEVSEFEMAGFTPVPADLVKPFRVRESPVQLECRVRQIMPLGTDGGAGNLVICDILRIHLDEAILDEKGRIHPQKIDLMGRMGRAFYARASGEAVYTVLRNVQGEVIGYPSLPASARESKVLTGNDLGRLAGISAVPTAEELAQLSAEEGVAGELNGESPVAALHRMAQMALAQENEERAAALVWLADSL